MILNMVGGGGAGLNFSVKAYASESALPSAEKENTIAVFTETEINGWVFSATVPKSPVDGMVHFTTSSAAVAEFNALKKNGIYVYPTGCTQYIDGEWVSKDAVTYQNGEWLSWVLFLYDTGVFYDIAGSMTQVGVKYNIACNGDVPGEAGSCRIQTNSDHIAIFSQATRSAIAYFSKKIDMTPYKTLVFNGGSYMGSYSTGTAVGVWSSFGTIYTDGLVASINGELSSGTHIIDVSNLSGEHYVGFWVCAASDATKVTVNQVYLK